MCVGGGGGVEWILGVLWVVGDSGACDLVPFLFGGTVITEDRVFVLC